MVNMKKNNGEYEKKERDKQKKSLKSLFFYLILSYI